MKNENPFIIKGYRGPDFFCDRKEETRKLVSAIKNGRDVTLMAPRRYGKTGLIHHLFDEIGNEYRTLYIDIFNIPNLTEFVKVFASSVVGDLSTGIEKSGKEILDFFRGIRPTMTLQSDGTLKFSFDIVPSQAEATLRDTFEFLKARKTVPVIAIDEFQQVRSFPEKGAEALLRSHIQFCHNARFIFAGSKRHLMEEMFALPMGPFYQSTQLMSLDVIPCDKYSEFAGAFFRTAGKKFDEHVFRRLYEKFDGITWYLQAVLNRVWDSADGMSSDASVHNAIDTLVEENAMTYHDLLASQTASARAILKAIADEGCVKEVSARDFLKRNSLLVGSTTRYAARNLAERDLLYRTPAGYRIYDRVFDIWLSRL